MKKRFGLIALLLTVVFMLSSCQLIQAFNAFKELADEIRDSISVYVANGTDATINVYYEQDSANLKDGATPQKGSFDLNKDAVKEKEVLVKIIAKVILEEIIELIQINLLQTTVKNKLFMM